MPARFIDRHYRRAAVRGTGRRATRGLVAAQDADVPPDDLVPLALSADDVQGFRNAGGAATSSSLREQFIRILLGDQSMAGNVPVLTITLSEIRGDNPCLGADTLGGGERTGISAS